DQAYTDQFIYVQAPMLAADHQLLQLLVQKHRLMCPVYLRMQGRPEQGHEPREVSVHCIFPGTVVIRRHLSRDAIRCRNTAGVISTKVWHRSLERKCVETFTMAGNLDCEQGE